MRCGRSRATEPRRSARALSGHTQGGLAPSQRRRGCSRAALPSLKMDHRRPLRAYLARAGGDHAPAAALYVRNARIGGCVCDAASRGGALAGSIATPRASAAFTASHARPSCRWSPRSRTPSARRFASSPSENTAKRASKTSTPRGRQERNHLPSRDPIRHGTDARRAGKRHASRPLGPASYHPSSAVTALFQGSSRHRH